MGVKRKNPGKKGARDRAGVAAPTRRRETTRHEPPEPRYEPPTVERLGSLRDLLAVKSGPGLDPSPIFPQAKK